MATNRAFIEIGVRKDAVVEARKAIIDILNTKTEESTKQVALEVLRTLCNSGGNTFTNLHLKG